MSRRLSVNPLCSVIPRLREGSKALAQNPPIVAPNRRRSPLASLAPTPYHPTMSRKTGYQSKLTSPEDAVRVIKSGDLVYIPAPPQPSVIMQALTDRRDELRNVKVCIDSHVFDPGWLQPGWGDSFYIVTEQFLGLGIDAYNDHLIDYSPLLNTTRIPSLMAKGVPRPIDVILILVSPPDANGFCSFGYAPWDKAKLASLSKVVLAQVDETQIRTHGSNYIHVDDIDMMVEHTDPLLSDEEAAQTINAAPDPNVGSLLTALLPKLSPDERTRYLPQLAVLSTKQVRAFASRMGWTDPPEIAKTVAAYVAELVPDGATLQTGIGTPSGYLPLIGAFDGKRDLGWHSELTAPGALFLIEKGIVTGARKTIHRDKAIFTCLHGATGPEIEFAHNNPAIELLPSDYVVNARTIAQHDNMFSINNALSIDLTGQINAESVFGDRQISGTGGQLDFQLGAIMSNGGRALTLLWSTALDGAVSRIVSPAGGTQRRHRAPHLRRHHSHRVRCRPTSRQINPGEGPGADQRRPPQLPPRAPKGRRTPLLSLNRLTKYGLSIPRGGVFRSP